VSRFDRNAAGAEAQLDRWDDAPSTEPQETGPSTNGIGDRVDPDEYGMHVDDPDSDLLDDDLDAGLRDDVEADAIDAIAEAFNARDLDGLLEIVARDGEAPGLLGYDVANLPQAVEDLWQRRPSLCLTRGSNGTEHVGVLWEHDGQAWWRLAALHVDDVTDGRVGVLEISDDTTLLEQVHCEAPDTEDLDEGARWSEWADGADGNDHTDV
jgi:hypothetical protein